MGETMNTSQPRPSDTGGATTSGLRRTITLPMLVFYGLGVTVGAGIFALVGEIVDISGSAAPWAFLAAGVVAGVTALCYGQLIARHPRAGGEAVYATVGLGRSAGFVAGLGVVVTGTISSAAIAVAFAGYVNDLVSVPDALVIIALIGTLAGIAAWGVRESVIFAAVITVLEVGTLLVVIVFGTDRLGAFGDAIEAVGDGVSPILAGAVVAFFAFVGFEDIANMAEETVDPTRTGPKAIVITLVVTILVYVVLATIAVSVVDRAALVESDAPMSFLFEAVTGADGGAISAIAVIAMVNGVLVQLVMASRVLYGMSREGLLPARLAETHPVRQTPVRATALVAGVVVFLALFFPLVGLAKATSIVTFVVFTIVDLSLVMIIRRERPDAPWTKWALVGVLGALLATGLGLWEIGGMLT